MSETKPHKRIVSKRRFVVAMGKKLTLFSIASLLFCLSLVGLVFASTIALTYDRDSMNLAPFGVIMLVCIFVPTLVLSIFLFVMGKAIEPVQPITDNNARLLPLQDTLVRSSDVPPTEQQAELLRAIQTGQETPPEQLLRAGQGDDSP